MDQQIVEILRTAFDARLRNAVITNESRLEDDLGIDSMEKIELQVMIEDKFRIRFSVDETDFLEAFGTLGSLTDCVARIKANSADGVDGVTT